MFGESAYLNGKGQSAPVHFEALRLKIPNSDFLSFQSQMISRLVIFHCILLSLSLQCLVIQFPNSSITTKHHTSIRNPSPASQPYSNISMAPRAPKPKADNASSTPFPLEPKTEKAKVEKVKVDKPKAGKAKAAKAEKVKLEKVKTEKVEKVEKPKAEKAEKSVKKTREKDGKDGKDGKGEKGEKVKPVTGDEAVELMTAYLRQQNRPYSATEISANLHGKVYITHGSWVGLGKEEWRG